MFAPASDFPCVLFRLTLDSLAHACAAVPGVVCKVANNGSPRSDPSVWKTFAVYSGSLLQFGVCMVVFGYLGHRLAVKTHHTGWIIAGVAVGVVVGASGLAFLVRQILGDKR